MHDYDAGNQRGRSPEETEQAPFWVQGIYDRLDRLEAKVSVNERALRRWRSTNKYAGKMLQLFTRCLRLMGRHPRFYALLAFAAFLAYLGWGADDLSELIKGLVGALARP